MSKTCEDCGNATCVCEGIGKMLTEAKCGTCGRDMNDAYNRLLCREHFTASIAALTSELAEARSERAMFCALVESLTSERDEARRQLGEAAKLLRDCPLGYANGALIHHRSTTAADVVAWLARAEEARTALASAAMAGGPHKAGEAK